MLPRETEESRARDSIEVKPAEPLNKLQRETENRSKRAKEEGERKELKTETKGDFIEKQVGEKAEESARKGNKEKGALEFPWEKDVLVW